MSGQSIAIAVTITAALCVHLSIFFWWRTRWGQFRFRKQRAGSGSLAQTPRAVVDSEFSTHAPSQAAADEHVPPGEAARREMLRRLTAASAQADIDAKAPKSAEHSCLWRLTRQSSVASLFLAVPAQQVLNLGLGTLELQ